MMPTSVPLHSQREAQYLAGFNGTVTILPTYSGCILFTIKEHHQCKNRIGDVFQELKKILAVLESLD